MVHFAIETDNSDEAFKFFADTRERLQSVNILKNPFHGEIKTFVVYDKITAFISMKPIYPGTFIFGSIILLINYSVAIIRGGSPNLFFNVVAIFFILAEILRTPQYFGFVLKRGLRKAGYKGKVSLIDGGVLFDKMMGFLR